MRYFFFGSLMDPELLAVVLGRGLAAAAFEPAVLGGFARYRVRGEAFPMLAAEPGGRVDGVLVHGLGAEDAARIAWYETDDYDIAETAVRRADGTEVAAYCCLPRPGALHDGIAWDYVRWRHEDRAFALELARDWMASYGSGDAVGAERSYQARKRRLLGSASKA